MWQISMWTMSEVLSAQLGRVKGSPVSIDSEITNEAAVCADCFGGVDSFG
jgi:hypothetical protein